MVISNGDQKFDPFVFEMQACLDFIESQKLTLDEFEALTNRLRDISRRRCNEIWINFIRKRYNLRDNFEMLNMIYELKHHDTYKGVLTFLLENDDVLVVSYLKLEEFVELQYGNTIYYRIFGNGKSERSVEPFDMRDKAYEEDFASFAAAMYKS